MRLAEIDHRLDGEQHAGLERQAFARLPVMQDVRPVVEHAAQAMAAEVAHHAAALAFGISLDRRADIAGRGAGLDRGHAAHQRIIGHLEQPLGGAADLAHAIHAARIAMPAVDDERHVDIEDVALFERARPRNAVADHVVQRGADRFREAAIIERRRDRAVRHGEIEHEGIERLGGHAGLHLIDEEIEDLGHEPAGLGHAGEGFRLRAA